MAWNKLVRSGIPVAALLMLGTLPAAADSRALVRERMAQCDSLADTRLHLECLYGAVQPLRSELGLPQAPQAATFAGVFNQPVPQALPGGRPNLIPSQPPAGQQQQQAVVQQRAAEQPGFFSSVMTGALGIKTTKVAPEQFGLRNARPGPGVNVDHITARMAEYNVDRKTGAFTVTLDNGQVWRRGRTDDPAPTWRKPAPTYVATISNGALGTFNLNVAGERTPYKVERVR